MNFIFDIGNVIISFQPRKFLHTLWSNEANVDKLFKTIFFSPEWEMLDKGIITEQEAVECFCRRNPDHRALIRQTMECWYDMLIPDDETISIIQQLNEQGHALYYLSNYHEKPSEFILSKYPVFGLFKGGLFSWEVHMVKPDIKIYEVLLGQYRLAPQDCVFIDDTRANVEAAEKLGIKGIHFTSAENLKNSLKTL